VTTYWERTRAGFWRPCDAGLEIPADTSPSDWIAAHLHPGTYEVHMTAPDCFDAYTRIFFPFHGGHLDERGHLFDAGPIAWTEMAPRNGQVPHALMEEETICNRDGEPQPHSSGPGFVTEQYEALYSVLARYTSTWTLPTDPRFP
jgi:hypothetical protein